MMNCTFYGKLGVTHKTSQFIVPSTLRYSLCYMSGHWHHITPIRTCKGSIYSPTRYFPGGAHEKYS
jgi:hypothetical protein